MRNSGTPGTKDVWTDTEKESDDITLSDRSDSGVTSPNSHHHLEDRQSASPCDLSVSLIDFLYFLLSHHVAISLYGILHLEMVRIDNKSRQLRRSIVNQLVELPVILNPQPHVKKLQQNKQEKKSTNLQ